MITFIIKIVLKLINDKIDESFSFFDAQQECGIV